MLKVFNYRCKHCGFTDEYWLKTEDLPQCKSCGSTTMTKLLSPTKTNWAKTPFEQFL